MTTDAESRLALLRERLAEGEYSVDLREVAEAILRRPGGISLFQFRHSGGAGTPPVTTGKAA